MTKLTQEWARIKVNKTDLTNGDVSNTRNAVARAIRRTLGIRNVDVGIDGVVVSVGGRSYFSELPQKVSNLLLGIGNGDEVSPLSFSIRFNVA